jgi:hypothetical protein
VSGHGAYFLLMSSKLEVKGKMHRHCADKQLDLDWF